MTQESRLTVLVENTVRAGGLLGEHGFSVLLESDGKKVLFDTGQGLVLRHNVEVLGVSLRDLDAVVLSHGHYDHAGGLDFVLAEAPGAKVFMHPAAWTEKFTLRNGRAKRVGIPAAARRAIDARRGMIVETKEPVEVVPGIWVTGEIPRRTSFEDTGGQFYLDENREKKDPMFDDQAVFLDTPDGVVVLLGCAHSGVINTLDLICELTGKTRVHAVIGGTHLLRASEERLASTAAELRKYEVRILAAGHCTGHKASVFLAHEFPAQFAECVTGSAFQFSG